MANFSQCSNCGKTFVVESDEVLYCTPNCEKQHDFISREETEGHITREWGKKYGQ